jgi:hypothetical protein
MPVIGEWKERQAPRSPFDANVRPWSVIARRAGPAVLTKDYGPVTSAGDVGQGGADAPRAVASLERLVP